MIHRPALDNARNASVFISSAVVTRSRPNSVLSDLTGNNNNSNGCFLPRKRARVGDLAGATLNLDMQGQRALLPLVSAPVPLPLPAGDVQNRLLCSASASTSGHPTPSVAPVSQGLLSHLYRHGVEIDALVRIEVG
jgi:E3 ubiquitin-protein ligase BOI and related proteins